MKKKYLFLCVAFVFFIYVVKFDVLGKLKRQYVEWKQVRFLDDEFHVLKSKNEIIELEALFLYDPSLEDFLKDVPQTDHDAMKELYIYRKNQNIQIWANKLKTKQYTFKKNIFYELSIFPSPKEKQSLTVKLINKLGIPSINYENSKVWDVDRYRIVFEFFDSEEGGVSDKPPIKFFQLYIFKFKDFDK